MGLFRQNRDVLADTKGELIKSLMKLGGNKVFKCHILWFCLEFSDFLGFLWKWTEQQRLFSLSEFLLLGFVSVT